MFVMIIVPALLGLILCLLNAGGANLFCLTIGCQLYAGYTLFGYSFYVYGAVGFGLIALLALVARNGRFAAVTLLGVVIALGLLLDLVALVWQNLYWSCASCLIVALFLGWAALGFWRTHPRFCGRFFKGLLLVWGLLLLPVLIAAGKEVLLPPWAIYGPANAEIRVFFSPTCPACGVAVEQVLASPAAETAAFYPVAKSDVDLQLLAQLLARDTVDAQALRDLFAAEPDPDVVAEPNLRWRLARNRMVLARYGVQTIPLVLSPRVLQPPAAAPKSSPAADLFSPPDFLGAPAPDGCGILSPTNETCE